MKLYHITKNDAATIESILIDGLRANKDGHIFLFENFSYEWQGVKNLVADHIACNQVFLDEYAMFEIDSKGISRLEKDDVGEITTDLQWIATQLVIEAEYINLFGIYKTNFRSHFQMDKNQMSALLTDNPN